MDEERKNKLAQNVLSTICSMFDKNDFKYDLHSEDMCISTVVNGDDIPMDFLIVVNAERQRVSIFSPLRFKIPDDKVAETAIAVAVANDGLVLGNFDFDISEKSITFRMATSYMDSILGEQLFQMMFAFSMNVVDDYNDRFLMLSKGMISLEKFIEMENND